MAKRKKRSSGYTSRGRILMVSAILAVAGAAASLYVLSIHPDISFLDIRATRIDSTSSPTEVVTPAASSEVPSLVPKDETSKSVMRYQSTNWAGYLSTGGKFTSVTGTWVASTPSATSATVESGDGTWIGIGGITTADLIQVGTQNTISPSGIVTISAFYELLPANPQTITSIIIHPGDMVAASITEPSSGQWAISLSNTTTGQLFTTTVAYASSYSSVEWIQEDPHYPGDSFMLLDNFGTLQFSNATTTMNGLAMSAATSGASPVTMIGQGGANGHQAVPSELSGSAFTVTYR